MTKTIEEQIEEARSEYEACVYASDGLAEADQPMRAERVARVAARLSTRLATLEAVRDGRMIKVWATVSANADGMWIACGGDDVEPTGDRVMLETRHTNGDMLTVLRGYAHVPALQVHEVEADSEVPS